MASLHDLPLTDELVAGLEKLYPPKCPELTQSERDIFFYAGKRALVEHLRVALEHQKNKTRGNNDERRQHDRRLQTFNRLAGHQE